MAEARHETVIGLLSERERSDARRIMRFKLASWWREPLRVLRCPLKVTCRMASSDSDEEFETNLRRELIEIASVNGVSDVEALRDILIATEHEKS